MYLDNVTNLTVYFSQYDIDIMPCSMEIVSWP